MNHSHNFEFWPFQDAENTLSYTTRPVLDGQPILEVYHDHDGDWQFLCGTTLDGADLKLACLGCMLDRDASLAVLAKMPAGWRAVRNTPQSDWILSAYEEEIDEDEA